MHSHPRLPKASDRKLMSQEPAAVAHFEEGTSWATRIVKEFPFTDPSSMAFQFFTVRMCYPFKTKISRSSLLV